MAKHINLPKLTCAALLPAQVPHGVQCRHPRRSHVTLYGPSHRPKTRWFQSCYKRTSSLKSSKPRVLQADLGSRQSNNITDSWVPGSTQYQVDSWFMVTLQRQKVWLGPATTLESWMKRTRLLHAIQIAVYRKTSGLLDASGQ
jgi:hypothetical protein